MENRVIKLKSKPLTPNSDNQKDTLITLPLFEVDNSDGVEVPVLNLVGNYGRRSLTMISEHSHLQVFPQHFLTPNVLTWNKVSLDKWATTNAWITESQVLEFPYRVIRCAERKNEVWGSCEVTKKFIDVVEKYFFLSNGLVGEGPDWGRIHPTLSILIDLYNEHYLTNLNSTPLTVDNLVWYPEILPSDRISSVYIVIQPDNEIRYTWKKDGVMSTLPPITTRYLFNLPAPYSAVLNHRGEWNEVDYYSFDIECTDNDLPF